MSPLFVSYRMHSLGRLPGREVRVPPRKADSGVEWIEALGLCLLKETEHLLVRIEQRALRFAELAQIFATQLSDMRDSARDNSRE